MNFKSSGLIGSVEFNLLYLSTYGLHEISGISMHTDEFLKPWNGEAMGPRTPKNLSEYNIVDHIVD